MKKTLWNKAMPVVKSCGIHFHPAGTVIPQSWFAAVPDFDLWVTLSGRALAHEPRGASAKVTRGTCIWITPGDLYDFEVLEPMIHVWIHFDLLDEDGDLLRYMEVETPSRIVEIPDSHLIEQVARRIVLHKLQYLHASGRIAELAASTSAHFLKSLLLEFHYAAELPRLASSQGLTHHHHAVVSDALSWIHAEPEAALTPAIVARRYNYSLKHFSKIFRKITSRTLSDLIIESRVERARFLLINSPLNIAQIAHHLGYDDPFYFSRQFKKVAGASPLDFRRQFQAPPR